MGSHVDSVQLYKVRKILSELSTKKGRGTELVSLYVPPKKALHEVSNALREEYGTASNIKSDTTRNHVQDALTKTLQRLKLYKRTPENGIVIFAGALPTNGPGSEQVFLHEVTAPKAVQTYLYRCDDHFHLEILKDMLKEDKSMGILSIDNTETGLGIISGDRLEIVDVITSGVAGKHRAGGQSARRYERLRDMELTGYYHRIADHASKAFLGQQGFQGLIVSGPGPTKDFFMKEEYLDYRLQEAVKAVVDTSYAGREGVRELISKSADALRDIRLVEEKQLVQRFLREANSEDGLAAYGVKEVLTRLSRASVETVLVSEDTGLVHLRVTCKKCGKEKTKIVKKHETISEIRSMRGAICDRCKADDYEVVEGDMVEFLADRANESGARAEVISSKSEEGAMLQSFGGVAALLRYK